MCLPMMAAAVPAIGTALGGTGAAAGATGAASTWATMGTMAKIGTVAQGLSGVAGAYGAHQQSQAAQAAANASAKAADKAAIQAMQAGTERSDIKSKESARMLGQQRAAMAANGVDVTSNSALDILDDTRRMASEDAYAIRTDAERQASGYGQTAANYRTQAANQTPGITAATTLLGSATKVSDRWAKYGGY